MAVVPVGVVAHLAQQLAVVEALGAGEHPCVLGDEIPEAAQ
jgi:hypothetical protein